MIIMPVGRGLAVPVGRMHQPEPDFAVDSLPSERRRLAEVQSTRDTVAFAASHAARDSHIHDIVRLAEKNLAATLAHIASLERAMKDADSAL